MAIKLKNKNVLITAGPTAVPIDSVRVISNNATGETGILLANKFSKLKAKVTLLLGSPAKRGLEKNVRVIPFRFFGELKLLLDKLFKENSYHIIIHSAAVSDFEPLAVSKAKINSNLKEMKLTLKPTPKLINSLRKKNKNTFLVGFKFEPELKKNKLINEAKQLLNNACLNLVVANTTSKNKYLAYLIGPAYVYGPFNSKNAMANSLIKTAENNRA